MLHESLEWLHSDFGVNYVGLEDILFLLEVFSNLS